MIKLQNKFRFIFSLYRKSIFEIYFKVRRYSLPKAFTEKGLYMLATILKSQRATSVTFAIILITLIAYLASDISCQSPDTHQSCIGYPYPLNQRIAYLFLFEGNGKRVLHTDGFAIYLARLPLGHSFHQADGFGFKFRFKLRGCVAKNLYVRETSVNFNNECNDYPSSDSFLLGFRRVLYVSLYPRKKSCISTREKGRMSPTSYTLPLAFDSRIFFSLASAISLAFLASSLASLAFVSLSITLT